MNTDKSEKQEIVGENTRLREWLEWIAAHSIHECDIPGKGYPYLNKSPDEGATLALTGKRISEYDER